MTDKAKQRRRALAEKLDVPMRTAANIIRKSVAIRTNPTQSPTSEYEGPIYIWAHVAEAVAELFDGKPTTPRYTAQVWSRERLDSEVKWDRAIPEVPLVGVTLMKAEGSAVWVFEGGIAFVKGELYDGDRRLDHTDLETEQSRERLRQAMLRDLRSDHPWLFGQMIELRINDGFSRREGENEENLIVVVTMKLACPPEDPVTYYAVLHGQAGNQTFAPLREEPMVSELLFSFEGPPFDTDALLAEHFEARFLPLKIVFYERGEAHLSDRFSNYIEASMFAWRLHSMRADVRILTNDDRVLWRSPVLAS